MSNRPPGGRGLRGVFRRAARELVPAVGTRDLDPPPGHEEGDDGSAGVREPRRPKQLGPMSGAGALPPPEPPAMIVLPDPHR